MRRPALAALAVTALMVLGVTGCASGSGGGATAEHAGSELRLAIGGEPEDGFDPTLGWGRYGSPLFQSTLLKLDAGMNIVSDLATDYEVSEDGLTWTLHLRDDAHFSDGTPVTADDVAYTFLTAKESPGLTSVAGLADAQAVDDQTVVMTLEKPQSTFVYRLTSLGIVPKTAHEADGYAQHPIGSGPFTLVQWDQGQQLIVERNENYYGTKPEFERIVFVFTDEDGTLASARAGELDMAGVSSSLVTGDIAGMKLVDVPSIDNRGVSLPTVPDEGKTTDAGAPIGNDVTSDLAVRRALNIGADRQSLVDGVLNGYGSPASGPVDGAPWHNPDSAIEDNRPDEARAMLEEAGWTDSDDDGIREKGGITARFELLYPAGDSVREGIALAFADQIRPLGIDIEVVSATWDEIYQRQHADAVLFGWGAHDPTEMYNLYSAHLAGIESWNPGFYDNPAVQAHLDAAMSSNDPEAANEEWKAAQLDSAGNGFTAKGDAAWAWLVNVDHTYYVSDCLDLGTPQTEPHGHGWPITAGIESWRWTC